LVEGIIRILSQYQFN